MGALSGIGARGRLGLLLAFTLLLQSLVAGPAYAATFPASGLQTNTSGTQITISYSPVLLNVGQSKPVPANYQLLVNGAAFSGVISSVTVGTDFVTLALGGATIQWGQNLQLSYASTTNARIYESGGKVNWAENFSAVTVTNQVPSPDTTAPLRTGAATNTAGTAVILSHNEALDETSVPSSQDYSIQVNAVNLDPSTYQVSIAGSQVTLTLDQAIRFGQSINLSYQAPTISGMVRDLYLNPAVSFSLAGVTNNVVDLAPPTLISLATNTLGSQITITFNEELDEFSAPTASDFVLTVDGIAYGGQITTSVFDGQVTLSLGDSVSFGQTLRLSYQAGVNPIQDFAGNPAANFSSQLVSNLVADIAGPALISKATNTLGTEVILEYNRALDTSQTPSVSDFTLKLNSVTYSSANLSVAFSGSAQVVLALAGTTIRHDDSLLLSYTGTTIIAAGNYVAAATFSDLVISNLVPDTDPPVMISAQTNTAGTQVNMYSSEPLDTTKPLASAAFTLTLDGQVYPVENFTTVLRSDGVDLLLTGTSIRNGQGVRISYGNTTYKIYDLAGNYADSMPEQLVLNQVPDTTAPGRVSLATNTSGLQILLRYNEDLLATAISNSAFSVVVGGLTGPTVSGVSIADDLVTISLASALPFGKAINLSYDNTAANPLRDLAGNLANSFTGQVVQNQVVDNVAPTPTGFSTNASGDVINILWSEELALSTPPTSSFVVSIAGSQVLVQSVFVTDSLVRLTLASVASYGQAISVSYTAPVTNQVKDLSGNLAASFTPRAVQNNVSDSSAPFPIERSVSVDGASLYGIYDRDLDPAYVPSPSEYTVKVNGAIYSPSSYSLAISGSRITMTIQGDPIQNGDLVLLSYFGTSLRALDGPLASKFTDYQMANPVPDTTKPQLLSAVTSTDGTQILMLSTEPLDTTKPLTSAAFELRINGVLYDQAQITVSLKSDGVDLILTGPKIRYGDEVTLAYSASGDSNKIYDLAGNFADNVPEQLITNQAIDEIKPVISLIATDGTGSKIQLTYNENLDASSVPASAAFTVRINGVQYTGTTSVGILGRVLTLTLGTSIASGQTVDVSYDPANTANKLQDLAGNDADALFQAVVINTVADTSPPVPLSKVTNTAGTEIRVRFNEPLAVTSVPASGDFALRINGILLSTSGYLVSISNDFVILTLTSAQIQFGQSVTLAYTPGVKPITDAAGNQAAGFTREVVTNNVPAPPATVPQAVSKTTNTAGSQVIITFDQSLDTSSVPVSTEFALRVDGSLIASGNLEVSISGSAVIIQLSSVLIGQGQSVSIEYFGTSIRGELGGLAAAQFAAQTVNNIVSDTTKPALLSISTNSTGNHIELRFSEQLTEVPILSTDFVITVAGVTYSSASYSALITGSRVYLALQSFIASGQQIFLSYNGSVIADLSGNLADTFLNSFVTNAVGDINPPVVTVLESFRVEAGTTAVGQALADEAVAWSEALDSSGFFSIAPISGIITVADTADPGVYSYTIRATDLAGNITNRTITIEIFVPDYGYPVVLLSSAITLPTGTVNIATATANEPVTWVESFDPSGYFEIDSTSGVITAAPNTPAGTYTYTITAIDADDFETDATITISLRTPSPPTPSGGGGVIQPVESAVATELTPVTAQVFPGQKVVIGARIPSADKSKPFEEVSVTMPGDLPIELRLSIQPALTHNQVALGLMTLLVSACDCDGVLYRDFVTPIEIRLTEHLPGSQVVHSEDGIEWDLLPLLENNELAEDQLEGYYLDQQNRVVILTRHLSYFGTKLPQPALRLESRVGTTVAGNDVIVNKRGGAGRGELTLRSLNSKICKVIDQKLVTTINPGDCRLQVLQGSDGAYLPAKSELLIIKVTKPTLKIQLIGNKQLVSYDFGQRSAGVSSRVQIQRFGSKSWITVRTIRLTSTGKGWSLLLTLRPQDAVRVVTNTEIRAALSAG